MLDIIMAFEGNRNTFASNYAFPTKHQKANRTGENGGNGNMEQPFIPTPSFTQPENHHINSIPWSKTAQEDPIEPLAQNSINSRNLPDGTDCDSETDLYGLVSNILEDGDTMDSYSTQGNTSKCTSIWSPQTMGKDLLQSDNKNGFNSSNHWLSTSSNGNMDNYKPQSQKLTKPPPDLRSMENCFPTTYENTQLFTSNDTSRGICGPMNNISILKNGFAQSKMGSHFSSYYDDDHYTQSSTKPYQQNTHEVNKLASNFQDVMAIEEMMVYQKNQIKLTNSSMPTHCTYNTQEIKSILGDSVAVQREQNGGFMQHSFQCDGSKGQNSKYFQQSKSTSFNPPKSYHNKMMTQSRNSSNLNHVLNPYSQDQVHQTQLQNKYKATMGNVVSSKPVSELGSKHFPQMQRNTLYKQDYSCGDGTNVYCRPGRAQNGMIRKGDGDSKQQLQKNRLQMAGFAQDGFHTQRSVIDTRLQMYAHNRDSRHGLPENNQFFQSPGNIYGSQRFGVGNSSVGSEKNPQFLPFMYSLSQGPRQNSFQMGLNSSNLSSRPAQPYGSGSSCRDIGDVLPESEHADLNPKVCYMTGCSGESTYTGMPSTLKKIQGGPMSQINYYLEECCEQLMCLEKERKKTIVVLTETFPGKQISVVTSSPLPKMPPNTSRVDQLIVDQICEQARVVNLLCKMERLSSIPFHANITLALNRHYDAICATQAIRKEEFINTSNCQKQGGAHFRDNNDVLLANTLDDLCTATRKSCTTLWCALQMTIPKCVGLLDQHGITENTTDENSPDENSPEKTF